MGAVEGQHPLDAWTCKKPDGVVSKSTRIPKIKTAHVGRASLKVLWPGLHLDGTRQAKRERTKCSRCKSL